LSSFGQAILRVDYYIIYFLWCFVWFLVICSCVVVWLQCLALGIWFQLDFQANNSAIKRS